MHTWKTVIWTVCVAIGVSPANALTITGQVVDSKARPVQDAEVVVCERYGVDIIDEHAKTISPIVRTDVQGRFEFNVDATLDGDVWRQRNVFVLARKTGLAYAWEWLNCSLNTVTRKHFPLVLEPACVLEGQVVDADGRPVAGAEVQATPLTTSGFSGVIHLWTVFGPSQWFVVTTDSQGRFRIEQLASDASAGLRVRAPGGQSQYAFRGNVAEQFGFSVGQPAIRLTLPREGTIKGRIQDEQGQPASGVELLVHSGRGDHDITNLYISRTTRSDSTGGFVFEGIPEGPHQIEVLAPEEGPDLWTSKGTKVSVKAREVAEAAVRVGKGGVLEVTALDARTRRPLVGAQVSPRGLEWIRRRPAITDTRGVARMRTPAGSYVVFVTSDRCSRWQSTEEVADGQTLQYEATLTPWRRVSGKVLDPGGQPVAIALVILHGGDHVLTDRSGQFNVTFDGNREGKGGYLVARDPGRGLASVVAVDNPSDSVEVRLGPAWKLVGKVTDPNGVGVPAARVNLDSDAQGGFARMDVMVLTDSQGRFTMEAIPPMQKGFGYRLSVNVSGFGPCKYKRITPDGVPGATVDIGTFSMIPANESISGIVMDAKGIPSKGIPVGAFTGGLGEIEQPLRSTATNDRGEFTITRLCRGPVNLQAGSPDRPGDQASVQTQIPSQPVKIVLGKNTIQRSETSVLGKSLPDLKDLGLTLADANDKPLLVCFVDIEQRPSRQCLSNLAKKTGALSAKGVSVVVVQVAKVGLRQYKDWLKAAQIDLPIHVAEGDFETKKRAWAVKALPWLILTDKGHKVTAEGFAVSELDELYEKAK
jgi:protocatechuate 3,4-dioxygenase beta subunit